MSKNTQILAVVIALALPIAAGANPYTEEYCLEKPDDDICIGLNLDRARLDALESAPDSDTLAELDCMDGDTIVFDGMDWECVAPDGVAGMKTVFVTSGAYDGNLVSAGGGVMGFGLQGADNICNAHALNGVVPPGDYIAWLPTATRLAVAASPRSSAAGPTDQGHIVPGAPHPGVTPDARPGTVPVAEHRIIPDKYSCDLVSHATRGHSLPQGRRPEPTRCCGSRLDHDTPTSCSLLPLANCR